MHMYIRTSAHISELQAYATTDVPAQHPSEVRKLLNRRMGSFLASCSSCGGTCEGDAADDEAVAIQDRAIQESCSLGIDELNFARVTIGDPPWAVIAVSDPHPRFHCISGGPFVVLG